MEGVSLHNICYCFWWDPILRAERYLLRYINPCPGHQKTLYRPSVFLFCFIQSFFCVCACFLVPCVLFCVLFVTCLGHEWKVTLPAWLLDTETWDGNQSSLFKRMNEGGHCEFVSDLPLLTIWKFSILCLLVSFFFPFFPVSVSLNLLQPQLQEPQNFVLFCLPFLNVLLGAGWDKMPHCGRQEGGKQKALKGCNKAEEKKNMRPKSMVGRVGPVREGTGLAARHDCFNNQGLELPSLRLLYCSQAAPQRHEIQFLIWIIL